MSALFLLIGGIAAGTAIMLYFAQKSPIGYQDESGFHFGTFDHCEAQTMSNVSSSESGESFSNDSFIPVWRVPWLIKGLGLASLLFTLVVFPKASKNFEPLALLDSPKAEASFATLPYIEKEQNEQVATGQFAESEISSSPFLAAVALVDEPRFSQNLCSRFSQVE